MYRFFVKPEQVQDGVIRITGQDAHHISHVLRMREGEQILISDESDTEYTCSVRDITEHEVIAEILFAKEANVELPCKITLFQCLPKSDKMELIIQKAVELGVSEIVPVSSARCVVKLDAKKEAAKLKRWQGISESAAKQAKRMFIPEVKPVHSFADAISMTRDTNVRLIPYELAKGMDETRSIINAIKPGETIAIFIGPEGGFTKEEVESAVSSGFSAITLGKRILRTETAGLMVLSVLGYMLEA